MHKFLFVIDNSQIMILNVKFDVNIAFQAILRDQLERTGLNFRIGNLGEVEIFSDDTEKIAEARLMLKKFGISLVDCPKEQLVQKIKNVISGMIEMDQMPLSKISFYIGEQLGMNYSYLSTFFSEQTHTSIENYIILQKVEKAKQLLIQDFSLTDISYTLNYSSVAHLSGQFKKMTGLTPTAFKRIIAMKRESASATFVLG